MTYSPPLTLYRKHLTPIDYRRRFTGSGLHLEYRELRQNGTPYSARWWPVLPEAFATLSRSPGGAGIIELLAELPEPAKEIA